jgi:hypothetical protein
MAGLLYVRWDLIHRGDKTNRELEAAFRRKARRLSGEGIKAPVFMGRLPPYHGSVTKGT